MSTHGGLDLGGVESQFLKRGSDLFDRMHAWRRHLPARNSRYGVIVNAGQFGDGKPGAISFVGVQCLENGVEFHDIHYADQPSSSQAHRPNAFLHHPQMPADAKKPPLLTAQQNLANLVFSESPSVNAWALKYELSQTTINRIVTGKMDPSTKLLEGIAAALARKGRHVEAWQFLAPNFGEGLHKFHITPTGETRVIPVQPPADNKGSGMRGTDSWEQKRNAGRRGTDKKQGDA